MSQSCSLLPTALARMVRTRHALFAGGALEDLTQLSMRRATRILAHSSKTSSHACK